MGTNIFVRAASRFHNKNLPMCEGSIVDIFVHHTTDLHPVTGSAFVGATCWDYTIHSGSRGPWILTLEVICDMKIKLLVLLFEYATDNQKQLTDF